MAAATATGLDLAAQEGAQQRRSTATNQSADDDVTTNADGAAAAPSLKGTTADTNGTSNGNGNGNGNVDEDEQTKALRKAFTRKYRHVAALHSQARPSTLSHDSEASPSFVGFRNLMVIVLELLAAQQARNSRGYFNRGRTGSSRDGSTSPTEDESRRFVSTWKLIALVHGINVNSALLITTYTVYFHIHHPLIGTLTEMHAVIVWLKTASYAFTNRDLRHAYLHPVKGELDALPELYKQCPYPNNITMKNLCYFWWAPTLIYQPVYPRSGRIRWVFFFKRVAEVFCLSVCIWFLSAQYATPVLVNSLDKIASLDMPAILERLLKLSTISLAIWLAGFFALFQSFLNALAEITRFGDRSFYEAWWNSESLGVYWRTWNKPVYQYFKRHVYSPMLGRGWAPRTASASVFLISAVLHEILVGVPTHNIIGVAFMGMFLQVPLIILTAPLEKRKSPTGKLIGNSIFWVSFTIFGQPLAALMYFYAWQAKYGSVSKMGYATSKAALTN
ncbi:diacylglycerol O-acyltransferase 1 [Pyricularia oryzae Y34]|uniref:diacylglycerol O-acyltransferase n=2 Tax=Pyricularia oryzae TaxID=318829 RepID=A0AA97PS70_PYRO3|nr:diacylglycerol O-acyltransferase 1 [Pyricularia oryzae Y34]